MKYSSSYKYAIFAVVSLATQPLVMATPGALPMNPVLEGFKSMPTAVSVSPAAATLSEIPMALPSTESSILSKAGWSVWTILKSPVMSLMSRIGDKADLLAENHPVICAALVAGGCYGIYSLYQSLTSGGVNRFQRVFRRGRQDSEEVLVSSELLT